MITANRRLPLSAPCRQITLLPQYPHVAAAHSSLPAFPSKRVRSRPISVNRRPQCIATSATASSSADHRPQRLTQQTAKCTISPLMSTRLSSPSKRYALCLEQRSRRVYRLQSLRPTNRNRAGNTSRNGTLVFKRMRAAKASSTRFTTSWDTLAHLLNELIPMKCGDHCPHRIIINDDPRLPWPLHVRLRRNHFHFFTVSFRTFTDI